MCEKADETSAYAVAESEKLAQRHQKIWRHDEDTFIIWCLCDKYGIEVSDRWYNHNPESVCEHENAEILWDFCIQTDHKVDHNKPDIVMVHKRKRIAMLIDIEFAFDTRTKTRRQKI